MKIRAMIVVFFLLIPQGAWGQEKQLKLGIENLSDSLAGILRSHTVGLVTNHTAKDQMGRRTIDVLLNKGIKVATLFVPEHGLEGTIAAGATVDNTIDTITQIPVVSLYRKDKGLIGKTAQSKTLQDVDVLIFDMQDVGMRHYTYISTLLHVMNSAVKYDKYLVVLDRPNPLGGVMEGPLVDKGLESFISVASIPVRHGLTIGELARYFNAYVLPKAAKLYVVSMENYGRTMALPETVNLKLSPNIINKAACHGYSFVGMLGEVRPFHTCVGTDKAFQCILLPESLGFPDAQWQELRDVLKKFNIQGVAYSYCRPSNKKRYHGLHITMEDINVVTSFNALIAVLKFFKKAGVTLTFSDGFDKAVGTKKVQEVVGGRLSFREFAQTIEHDLGSFFDKAQSILLYWPLPKMSKVV